MPIHDWSRVSSGIFHDFHQAWSIEIRNNLNRSRMPEGYYALVEQKIDGPEPDVIAIETMNQAGRPAGPLMALKPPTTKLITSVPSEAARYARKANRISIHHPLGQVVAVIEIVSPGNKDSRNSLRSFVDKAVTFLRNGIHVLIVDLFPPTPRDPQGLHKVIWDEFTDEMFELPEEKPLTLASYQSADRITAYVEPVGFGDMMPEMPLFLTPDEYIFVPLEESYQATWNDCPAPVRALVAQGPIKNGK